MGCGASTAAEPKQLTSVGRVNADANTIRTDDENERCVRDDDNPQTEPKEDDVLIDDLEDDNTTNTQQSQSQQQQQQLTSKKADDPRPNSTSQLSLNSAPDTEKQQKSKDRNDDAYDHHHNDEDDDVILESSSGFDIEDDQEINGNNSINGRKASRHASGMFGPRGPTMRKTTTTNGTFNNTNSNLNLSGSLKKSGGGFTPIPANTTGNKTLGRMGARPNAGSTMKNAVKVAGARGANFGGMAAAGQRR